MQKNQRSNCQHLLDHRKSKRIPEKNICFIDYAKAFDCENHNKWWKVPKVMWIPEQVICLQEICMQVNKQQLEPDMEQWAGSKVGNVYIKAVYYHSAYLTFMQSISCEMLCWMKHRYNPSSVFFILSNSFSIYNSLFFFLFSNLVKILTVFSSFS